MDLFLWDFVAVRTMLFLIVTVWRQATSQCSEAHDIACSQSIIKIEKYRNEFFPIGGLLPDYNRTTLRTVCSLFQNLQNCSQPYLRNCNNQTKKEFHMLHSAFTPICGNLMNDYLLHRSCFKSLETSYQQCQNRRQTELDAPKDTRIQYELNVCLATNQYVKCIYLATALKCSIDAANVYFQIISKSIALLLVNSNFVCDITHPSDVISVLTTTRPTLTDTSSFHMTSTSFSDGKYGNSNSHSSGNRLLSTFTTSVLWLCYFYVCSFVKIYDAIFS